MNTAFLLPLTIVAACGLGYWIARQVPDELAIGRRYFLIVTGLSLLAVVGLLIAGPLAHGLELWQAGIALAFFVGTDVYVVRVAHVGRAVPRRKPI